MNARAPFAAAANDSGRGSDSDSERPQVFALNQLILRRGSR